MFNEDEEENILYDVNEDDLDTLDVESDEDAESEESTNTFIVNAETLNEDLTIKDEHDRPVYNFEINGYIYTGYVVGKLSDADSFIFSVSCPEKNIQHSMKKVKLFDTEFISIVNN